MYIYDLTLEKLIDYFLKHDEKKFYATELFKWLYEENKRLTDFDLATNLKKEIREKTKRRFYNLYY